LLLNGQVVASIGIVITKSNARAVLLLPPISKS